MKSTSLVSKLLHGLSAHGNSSAINPVRKIHAWYVTCAGRGDTAAMRLIAEGSLPRHWMPPSVAGPQTMAHAPSTIPNVFMQPYLLAALRAAAAGGHDQAVDMVRRHGTFQDHEIGCAALDALVNNRVALTRKLLNAGGDMAAAIKEKLHGTSDVMLCKLAMHGHYDALKFCLHTVEVTTTVAADVYGWALVTAAEANQVECVSLLAMCQRTSLEFQNWQPLMVAVAYGHVATVHWMLTHIATLPEEVYVDALQTAIRRGNTGVVRELLDNKVVATPPPFSMVEAAVYDAFTAGHIDATNVVVERFL